MASSAHEVGSHSGEVPVEMSFRKYVRASYYRTTCLYVTDAVSPSGSVRFLMSLSVYGKTLTIICSPLSNEIPRNSGDIHDVTH